MYCEVYNKCRGKIHDNIVVNRNVVNEFQIFKVLVLHRKLEPYKNLI